MNVEGGLQSTGSESEKPFEAPIEDVKAWRAHDVEEIPKNNLPLVFFSLLLATFLVCARIHQVQSFILSVFNQAALDQTM